MTLVEVAANCANRLALTSLFTCPIVIHTKGERLQQPLKEEETQ
jgi:hypothetical protein